MSGTVCLDVREEKCYADYRHGAGVNPLDGLYPKSLCCCSTIGKAWGGGTEGALGKSEPCPRRGTPAFTELCPKVSDFVIGHQRRFFDFHRFDKHFRRGPVLSIAKTSTNA